MTTVSRFERRQHLARQIVAQSALTRRRMLATQRLAITQARQWSRRPLVLTLALICLATLTARFIPSRMRVAHDRALPWTRAAQEQSFDRLHWEHSINSGETIWGLAQHYYGSGALAQQERLRAANPELLADPFNVPVKVTIKIPVQAAP